MAPPNQRRRRSASDAQRQRSKTDPKGPSRPANRRSFNGLWLLCGLLYAAVGVILTGLAAPWVWAIAAVGTLLQGWALAGPQALQRFRWLTANLLVLVGIVGSGALAVALSIALNHLGTDVLDDLTLARVFRDVVLYSLLAVGLAGLCSLTTAALGDRLLRRYPGSKTNLLLMLTCLVGLAIGGAIGLVV